MYAILDVETTGLSAKSEKITEIAIYIHDGKKIVDEFSTLIDPERKIPYRITQITGINNKMVAGAPKFYEVAKKIIEFTDGKTIVGHNVTFDYNFIRSEFEEFDYDFKRKTLCTCKLSRKLIPMQKSYGLGNLCNALNIENPNRHRAAGDAFATTRLFELLLMINPELDKLSLKGLHSNLSKDKIDRLPHRAGVYYLHDDTGKVIYIGKSINIHDRIISHLNSNTTKKAIEMKNQIADISFELTGNDLTAMLLESHEIKTQRPIYNKSQIRSIFNYGLFSSRNEDGYLCLKIEKIKEDLYPITSYHSLREAKEQLHNFIVEHELCQKLCGLYKSENACFQYYIKECHGACVGKESPESYNARLEKTLEKYELDYENFFVIEAGRKKDEKAIVQIENGKYLGFGYAEPEQINGDLELLSDCINHYPDNRDVQTIIRGYLKRNDKTILIKY